MRLVYSNSTNHRDTEAQRNTLCLCASVLLKRVLQRKLQNSRIVRSTQLSEERIVLRRARILHTDAVRYVVRLNAEVHGLPLFKTKLSRQSHIERPELRSQRRSRSDVA